MLGVPWSIWIGFDPRETAAYSVARESIKANLSFKGIPTRGVVLEHLREKGLYYRPTRKAFGRLYDEISEANMSTEFAISRFLVPHIAKSGWAIFMDCDVLVRGNLARLFDELDDNYAVCCVKHEYTPKDDEKMDGQAQQAYPRKNWSSVMAFNCDHPANKALTVELVNTVPGRDLHRFCWLKDKDIGALYPDWNWLVDEQPEPENPKIVHYTLGGPWLTAFENAPYANEWHRYLWRAAA